MRKRVLTIGLLLILGALFILDQGVQILAPVAESVGLSTRYAKRDVVMPPTLFSVAAASYSFTSESLAGGGEFVGSVEVVDARQVGFYVMNEGNFSLWRAGQPASLMLANPSAVSYNFTFSPVSSGTYYFVYDNQENSPLVVVFSLSSVQDTQVLSPLVGYAAYELLFLGVVFSVLGLRGGRKAQPKHAIEEIWKCKFCGAKNRAKDHTFCTKCGRAQG
jgi:hypothetical protein